MRLVRLLGAAAASLAVSAAPALAAGPIVLGTTTNATVVGAADGWTAWSEASGGSFALVLRAPDETVTRPAVAPRGVPFDLDLGRDASGKVVATYSRCAREPQRAGGANATGPQWASGKRCALYALDVATGAERALGGKPHGGESRVLPSLSGSTLAYVRVAARPRGRAELVVRRSGHTRLVQRGTFRNGSFTVAGGPASVDADGTRVAAIWRFEDPEFHDFNSVLRVSPAGRGKTRQVAYGVNDDVCNYDSLVGATLTGGVVDYLRTNGSEWQSERARATLPAPGKGEKLVRFGPFARGGEASVVVTSAAVDGARLVISATNPGTLGDPNGPTQIQELPLGTFTRTEPGIVFCDG